MCILGCENDANIPSAHDFFACFTMRRSYENAHRKEYKNHIPIFLCPFK